MTRPRLVLVLALALATPSPSCTTTSHQVRYVPAEEARAASDEPDDRVVHEETRRVRKISWKRVAVAGITVPVMVITYVLAALG